MINTQEVLQDLLSKPFLPFTVFMLREEIEKKIAYHPEKTPQEIVISFLNDTLKELVKTIDIKLLTDISLAIKKATLDTEETLQLSSKPMMEEVADFCNKIHVKLQKTQQQKEELIHYISIFTQAKGYVTSFSSAAEIVLKETFDSRKELKNHKEAILNDMEVYKNFLSNMIKELSKILEDILQPRMNLQLRMESSLRLLEKYRDPSERMGFSIT